MIGNSDGTSPLARRIDQPEPGIFKVRLHRGGPWRPAILRAERVVDDEGRVADRGERLVLYVDGDVIRDQGAIGLLWPWMFPIDATEHQALAGQTEAADEVPDFGQGSGFNSRDHELSAAAERVPPEEGAGEAEAGRVAHLIKLITAEAGQLADELRSKLVPIKERERQLRAEYHCRAADHKADLLAWLQRWVLRHDRLPISPHVTVHFRGERTAVAVDQDKTPRRYLVPDERAIEAALRAGEHVPGWQLQEIQTVRVV